MNPARHQSSPIIPVRRQGSISPPIFAASATIWSPGSNCFATSTCRCIAVSFSQTRKAGSLGLYAAVTPLRFAEGGMHTIRRGRRWAIQRLYDAEGREMLYILNFYLPRFLDLPFREKLTTILHELWHIGPKFDGDVRRLGKRCFAHGSSQKQYDTYIEALVGAGFPSIRRGAARFSAAQFPRVIGPLRPRYRPARACAQAGAVGLKLPDPEYSGHRFALRCSTAEHDRGRTNSGERRECPLALNFNGTLSLWRFP